MAEKVTRSICRWCHSQCRVAVHTDNGKLVKIEEDPTDPRVKQIYPATRGCVRLAGAKEYVYHPNRVRFPMRRVGERGENKWERITWKQAIDEIAEKLEKIKNQYGPETLMITSGTGRSTQWVWQRFANIFGSPNLAGQGQI